VNNVADLVDAIMTIECDEDASEEDEIRALQRLINSGTWGLQGSYGRAMIGAIEAGVCALGKMPSRDYYGTGIPSRFDVEPGSMGSVEYVEANSPYGRVLEDD
jgi:hypothetical protein